MSIENFNNKTTKENLVSIINFYGFIQIAEPQDLMFKLLLLARKKSIKGTIILANEGFNGGISSVNKDDLMALIDLISTSCNIPLAEINYKVNYCNYHPFEKLKVKLKREIVTMGVSDLEIKDQKGVYIEPESWDDLIAQDNVILLDTRNDYEFNHGSFKGATNPNINTFREFPDWVKDNIELIRNKKVAMFCTGGIRCEKASSYLLAFGIKDVYQLRGGILQYLNDTKNTNLNWQGSCFVFDERIAVDDMLAPKTNSN